VIFLVFVLSEVVGGTVFFTELMIERRRGCLFVFVDDVFFVVFFFRKRFSLRKFSVPSLVSNGVTPRAYMSSLSAAEDIHKNDSSKAYGSDQIQVFFLYNISFVDSVE